jgi:F420-0:gamma-glutamyl ligase-like protein
MSELPDANPGKNLIVEINGQKYARYPIKTKLISQDDDIVEVVRESTKGILQPADVIVISERAVAITQGRCFFIDEIKPSRLANFLVKYVYKHPGGIGLKSPWTMQLAIDEVGVPRILLAALSAALTKPLGIRGMFYRVAGHNISAIDGPCDYTLPPGNNQAKLGPKNPQEVAQKIAAELGVEVAIIDANDYGQKTLGASKGLDPKFAEKVFVDNPLGQTDAQTPLAIVRKV